MRSILRSSFLMLSLLAWASTSANACPLCREAIPNSSGVEEQDQDNEGASYNNNIYVMVTMPYLLVGVVGFMIYRNVRANPKPTDEHEPPAPPES